MCLLVILTFGGPQPSAMIIALALGYVGPDLWLSKKIANRKFIIGPNVDLSGYTLNQVDLSAIRVGR